MRCSLYARLLPISVKRHIAIALRLLLMVPLFFAPFVGNMCMLRVRRNVHLARRATAIEPRVSDDIDIYYTVLKQRYLTA